MSEYFLLAGLGGGLALLISVAVPRRSVRFSVYRRDVVATIAKLPAGSYDLLHRAPGAVCPKGYLLIPRCFGLGGQFWDGCWNGKHGPAGVTVDFLLPGEDAAIGAAVRYHY